MIYIYIYIYTYIYICIDLCIYIYIYVCIYIVGGERLMCVARGYLAVDTRAFPCRRNSSSPPSRRWPMRTPGVSLWSRPTRFRGWTGVRISMVGPPQTGASRVVPRTSARSQLGRAPMMGTTNLSLPVQGRLRRIRCCASTSLFRGSWQPCWIRG